MSETNKPEQKEREKPSPKQENGQNDLHPFEYAQQIVELISGEVSSFQDAAEKTKSFSWVEVEIKDQKGVAVLKEVATRSIEEFNKKAIQLQESTMKQLEAEVERELAASETEESTEDRSFDRVLFLKEHARYKKTVEEGGRNIGLYRFKDMFVKLVLSRRSMSHDMLARMKDQTKDLECVFVPEDILDIDPKTRALVMPLAKGVTGNKLTAEEIQSVPDKHWRAFEATIRTLSDRGISTDLTKRSNFLYDKEKGFQFIDLDNISADGTSTEKFIEKDGKSYYFPFEHFRIFPKEYKGAKAMFEDIPSSQEK